MTRRGRIGIGLTVLGAVTVVGTIGYVVIEGAAFFDSLYMVVITITSVGFAEIFPLSEAGRVWTLAVLGLGLGAALYTAVSSIEYMIDLGEVRRRKNMQKEVARLNDHVILCGWGRVGRGTWHELRDREIPVVVIESLTERADAAAVAGAVVIKGDATHNDVLEMAGIDRAQALIACVADDSDNLVIALSVKALRPDLRVICRATEPESERKLRLAGADAVVAPQVVGSERLALLAVEPEVAQIFDVVVGGTSVEFHVEELDVGSSSVISGRTIKDSGLRELSGALILSVEGGLDRRLLAPEPSLTINAGDRLVVVGTKDQVQRAAEMVQTKH